MAARPAWSHNIAYFPFVEKVAGKRARRSAIDVGTANGMLASRLAQFIPVVVGLDAHAEQVTEARIEHPAPPGLRFELGDVLDTQLADEPYDFVVCSATLHHMDTQAGLERLRELTAPGGTLVIVGLALDSTGYDRFIHLLTRVPIRLARAARGWSNHGGPTAYATETWTDMKRFVRATLPGATFRRRLYWRYSVVWDRPSA